MLETTFARTLQQLNQRLNGRKLTKPIRSRSPAAKPGEDERRNKMIYALVEYINRYGNISIKAFKTAEEVEKFTAKLKSEYIVTIL